MAAGDARVYVVARNVLAYVQDHMETMFKMKDGVNTSAMADFVKAALADVNHPARAYVSPNVHPVATPKDVHLERLLTLFSVNF